MGLRIDGVPDDSTSSYVQSADYELYAFERGIDSGRSSARQNGGTDVFADHSQN
jgi:hypothetical protein